MRKVELLAPAGNLEKLKVAILYGANAVFCGGKQFSLRAKANNFTLEDLKEAVIFANKHKARVHVTVNIVPTNDDMQELDKYLLALDEIGVHAIIVSSIYIMKRAYELNCHFEVHVSTQQSIANSKAIEFFKENAHVKRVVLAREVNYKQMKAIKEKAKFPIEAFIHGGMCSSFSGRCTLSNSMSNRDANKGGCAHSCRWLYHLYQNDKLISDKNFILASADLMAINYIPKLLEANVDSFKIEGRMKSAHYIASVVNAYSSLINEYYKNKNLPNYRLLHYKKEISKAENRVTYTGFLNPHIKNEALLKEIGNECPTQNFIAEVVAYKKGYTYIEVRNYFKAFDKIELFTYKGNIKTTMPLMYDENNLPIEIANKPKKILKIKLDLKAPIPSFIRKIDTN